MQQRTQVGNDASGLKKSFGSRLKTQALRGIIALLSCFALTIYFFLWGIQGRLLVDWAERIYDWIGGFDEVERSNVCPRAEPLQTIYNCFEAPQPRLILIKYAFCSAGKGEVKVLIVSF